MKGLSAVGLELELSQLPTPQPSPFGEVDSPTVEQHLWYARQMFLLARSDPQQMERLVSPGSSGIRALAILRGERPEEYHEMLDELIELVPDNAQLREQRAESRSKRFDWKGASADFNEIIRIDPSDHWNRFRLAGILMYVGEEESFRELARDTVDRWEHSTEPRTMERTAKMCLISPDLDADLIPRLAAMAQRGVEDTSDDDEYAYLWHDLQSTGMAAYRQGQYAEAIEILDEIIPSLTPAATIGPSTPRWANCLLRWRTTNWETTRKRSGVSRPPWIGSTGVIAGSS